MSKVIDIKQKLREKAAMLPLEDGLRMSIDFVGACKRGRAAVDQYRARCERLAAVVELARASGFSVRELVTEYERQERSRCR